jgi:biotin carboxylase
MRIAVVDGFSTSRFLVEELAQGGVECVHLRSQPEFRQAYTRGFDPAAYVVDLGHVEEERKAAAVLRELEVDQVVAGTESGVVLADILGHELGLPGNDIATVRARRDKFEMARRVREAGLRAPSGALCTTREQAVAWFEEEGGRAVVVKPLSSWSTDGVRICRTAQEVRDSCDEVLGKQARDGTVNESVLVQEFLEGTEYIVNTVSVDGVHKVSDVWKSLKTDGPHGSPVYDYLEPVPRADPDCERVVAYAKQVVTALGIAQGAGHSEVMLTSSGPVLIEVGARLMGSTVPWIAAEHSGTSQLHLLALSLTDPDAFRDFADADVRWSRHVRGVYLINERRGLAGSTSWQQRIEWLATFAALNSTIAPGDVVPRTVDLATSPGFVYLAGESIAAVERDYEIIRSLEHTGVYLS